MPQSKQQAGTVKSLSVFSTLGRVRHGGGLVAKSSLTLAIPWTAVRQTPKSLGFPRQDNWRGLPFPSPGALCDPGIQPVTPAWQVNSSPPGPPGKQFIRTDPEVKGFLWMRGSIITTHSLVLMLWVSA